MKTLRQYFEKKLFNMLFFEEQAKEIMDNVISDKANEAMNGRWDDSCDGYPQTMLPVLWMSVKDHALKWIEEKQPNHMAKMVLTMEMEMPK